MANDPQLALILTKIMRAVWKRRAIPHGYALFVVLVKVPKTEDEAPAIVVGSAPAQSHEVTSFALQQAAESLNGQIEIHKVTRPKLVPTGNA
jgi:hypothetical protein